MSGSIGWRVAVAVCGVAVSGCSRRASEPPAAAAPVTAEVSAKAPTPTEFDDCGGADWCPRMIGLPGGAFIKGSPQTEPGRFEDEDQKRVSVPAFAAGKYLVTRGQWRVFATATRRAVPKAPCAYAPGPQPSWKNTGFPQSDDHPVVCVTWNDAQDYARWLTERTGHRYRLPSDDEWEYAARAGTTTAFPWGGAASHEHANYGLDQCCAPATEGRDRWEYTSPVGSFPPNPFGLYDMQGNVFEWVETCADAFEKLPRPPGATGCVYRYARGGVYADRPDLMRSAAKNLAPPPGDAMTIDNYRSAGFGFRVVSDPG